MKTLATCSDLQDITKGWKQAGCSIALVPTMGALHNGHESLIRFGRGLADKLVVSIFVNPTQFAPGEDLDKYPRSLEKDAAVAGQIGADILFTPSADEMYPAGFDTWIEVPKMSSPLCGLSRPTHFKGVCTVVNKLFNLSRADQAVFGEKDWQQYAIISRMASDLCMPIKLNASPTVREKDGLALSSRNAYLSPAEREQAPMLHKGLIAGQEMLTSSGLGRASLIKRKVLDFWKENFPLAKADYLEVVDPWTLEPVEDITGPARMLAAAYVGRTRLIDNIVLGRETPQKTF